MRHCKRLFSDVVDASFPGSIQGQAEWGSEQSGLEGGVPAQSRELALDHLNGHFQPKSFSDSMNL